MFHLSSPTPPGHGLNINRTRDGATIRYQRLTNVLVVADIWDEALNRVCDFVDVAALLLHNHHVITGTCVQRNTYRSLLIHKTAYTYVHMYLTYPDDYRLTGSVQEHLAQN